ncbi:hypothetical protein ACU4GR_06685 [Methylobacterium oryzae CBMB20]
MVQDRVGDQQRAVTGRVQAQAQIDVVEVDGEDRVVEAADRPELVRLDDQAGGGDRRDRVRGAQGREVAGGVAGEMAVPVGHEAAGAQDDATVLDPTRAVEEPGAHGADLRGAGPRGP